MSRRPDDICPSDSPAVGTHRVGTHRDGTHRDGAGPGDRGSAAVLALVLLGVVMTVTVLVAVVGGAVVDQRRAEAAADLGALAGASASQRGEDACAAARTVTGRNGARLTACAVADEVVTVAVSRPTRRLLGVPLTASSHARAGPASLLPG